MPPEITQSLNTNVAIGLIVFFLTSVWCAAIYLGPAVKDWILSRAAMHRAQETLANKLATHTDETASTLKELRDVVVVKGCANRMVPTPAPVFAAPK
jgi:hypothetical protein